MATQTPNQELLNYETAAAYLGIQPQTLRLWASRRQVPFCRVGKRLVRFRESDLQAYLDSRLVEAVGARR